MSKEGAIKRIKERMDKWALDDKDIEALSEVIPEFKESADERIRKAIESIIRVYGKTQGEWIAGYDEDTLVVHLRDAFAYLEKQKEQKPAEWSEEDKRMLRRCIKSIESSKNFADLQTFKEAKDKEKDWLKSLPERFNLQPKQEWNTHDKAIMNCIVCCLDGQFVSEAARKQALEWFNKHRRDFLNSPSWKPSEEQMEALESAVKLYKDTHFEIYHERIVSLYEQLKKLM